MSLLGEIKRRRVFQVAAVYLVVAWLIMQVVDVVNEPLRLPEWFATVAILLVAIGFPIALIISWAFNLTPEGVVRDQGTAQSSGRSIKYVLLGLMVAATVWVLYRVEFSPAEQAVEVDASDGLSETDRRPDAAGEIQPRSIGTDQQLADGLNQIALPLYVMEWEKSFGGRGYDRVNAMASLADGGLALAGLSRSSSGGWRDAEILKLDQDGELVWQRRFELDGLNELNSIVERVDGGLVAAGETSRGAGWNDAWIIKIDGSGNLEWERTVGGSSRDTAKSIVLLTNGGSIVAGATLSKSKGWADAWVFKLDSDGKVQWERKFGGRGEDEANAVIELKDGGYLLAGYTESSGEGGKDGLLIRLHSTGDLLWEKTIGGLADDEFTSLAEMQNGGYGIAGWTASKGAGRKDVWILNINESGEVIWERTFGGSRDDSAESLAALASEGLVVAANTKSDGAGRQDAWVIQIDNAGNLKWQKTYGGSETDGIQAIIVNDSGGLMLAGNTFSLAQVDGRSAFWAFALSTP